jgi:PAS domain S-box-containing protein
MRSPSQSLTHLGHDTSQSVVRSSTPSSGGQRFAQTPSPASPPRGESDPTFGPPGASLALPGAHGGAAGRAPTRFEPALMPEDPARLDLSRAVDDLAAPAVVIDRDGRFSWLNRAYLELFGDRRGQPFIDSIAPEHRRLARTNFARKVVGKNTGVYDLTVFDRSGARITLRTTSAPLRRGDEVVGVFGIGVPIPQAPPPETSVLDDLTPRQREVLRLLAEGLKTHEIAERLGVADETARNHIRGLLRAIGAHSRLEAVLIGLRLGAIDPHLTRPGHQEPPEIADD